MISEALLFLFSKDRQWLEKIRKVRKKSVSCIFVQINMIPIVSFFKYFSLTEYFEFDLLIVYEGHYWKCKGS